jgi:heat shock protein HtpX
MSQAYGLYGHIQANRLRSVFLLASFLLLLLALQFSLALVWASFHAMGESFDMLTSMTWKQFKVTWPIGLALGLGWVTIAYFIHHSLIRTATGAHAVTRKEAPELYNALENLCVSRGIPMPRLEIMESDALNAYAAGLKEGDYTVAVTRGLLNTLNKEELEAVLAHELTHIRNKDTQMMVIAIIFAGVFAFFGDMLIRGWDFPYGVYPRNRSSGNEPSRSSSDSDRDNRDRGGGGGGNGGAILAIIVAIAIILITWGVSTLIKFALSRSREYLADAGAVELTKNPDAMISALKKISANPNVQVQSRMEAFFIETPALGGGEGFASYLSTHPNMSDRIQALRTHAGGRA